MSSPIPLDKKLYETIKTDVYKKYPKHSAYRSMMVVKKYKDAGGKYKDDDNSKRNTTKWLSEKWSSVNDYYHDDNIVQCGNSNTKEKYDEYPLCKPLRVLKKLSKPEMKILIDEKNKLKEKHLLTSKFIKGKGAGDPLPMGVRGSQPPLLTKKNQKKYLSMVKIIAASAGYDSNKLSLANDGKHKLDLNGIKFGNIEYPDFVLLLINGQKEDAVKRRNSYLARTAKIRGDWKSDKFSKNNLARKIIWFEDE